MALAAYYNRAAQAASQVIGGFDPDEFRRTLEHIHVGISVGTQAATSKEGVALLDLAVRLLARFYPTLEIRAAAGAEEETNRAIELARRINPLIEIADHADAGISIGQDAPTFSTTVYAGSDGWDALVSTDHPVPTGGSDNPLGAGAAASFAAGILFNRVLLSTTDVASQNMIFSTFHRQMAATDKAVPNAGWTLTGKAILIGTGAIGNSAAWALARSPMAGTVHLVDHESIELSNLQRYVLSETSDEDHAKADVIAAKFAGPVKAISHRQTWQEFVQNNGSHWDNALVALDTAAGRRLVQATLPRWIANAWTQPGDLGLSTHGPFGHPGACLWCLYQPTGPVLNEDEVVAQALGVPNLVAEVRTLLHSGAGVAGQLLASIAAGLGVQPDTVVAYEGRTIRDLYTEGICGGGVLPLGSAGKPRQELHVPLAHQSGLAGILLAAALVRRALSSDDEPTQVTRIDMTRPSREQCTLPALKAGTGQCICEDMDYVQVYQAKYAREI